jgi:hypothetical protein
MENTKQNQFGTDEASFFISLQGDSFSGPFRPSEIQTKLENREIAWVDYCYRESEGKWIRICDHPVFISIQPEAPKPKPAGKVLPPPVPMEARKPRIRWFLFQSESQSGPYSEIEMKRLISVGQVFRDSFVWQDEFPDWKPILQVPEFLGGFQKAITEPIKPSDRRESPRKPLVARIYLTNEKEIASGMCRDISVGGMQVLTDTLPGKTGDRIHLNVMPPESSGLAPFVAHGVIVRILEDKRGFSFRFTDINDDAKSSIERYIS